MSDRKTTLDIDRAAGDRQVARQRRAVDESIDTTRKPQRTTADRGRAGVTAPLGKGNRARRLRNRCVRVVGEDRNGRRPGCNRLLDRAGIVQGRPARAEYPHVRLNIDRALVVDDRAAIERQTARIVQYQRRRRVDIQPQIRQVAIARTVYIEHSAVREPEHASAAATDGRITGPVQTTIQD